MPGNSLYLNVYNAKKELIESVSVNSDTIDAETLRLKFEHGESVTIKQEKENPLNKKSKSK